LPQKEDPAPEPEQAEYDSLIIIENYYDRHEAEFAKSLLASNGIYAVFRGDYDIGNDGEFSTPLFVNKRDAWEAKNLLDEIKKTAQEPTPRKNAIKKIAAGLICLLAGVILIAIIIKIIQLF